MNKAFTLAEILITLTIIGVVATITIPTLITTHQDKGWNTASIVFEKKLTEALKIMNSQGILAGYRTTEDFVSELSKHLKISKVCKKNNLMSCFEDKVFWGAGETTPEEVDMSKIKTSFHFGQKTWNTNLVGLQLANGTSAIVAYNPDCKQDPYNNQVTGTSCLAILYDTSGYSKPNTSGKDLRSINVKSLDNKYAFEIAGTRYTQPFYSEPHFWKACESDGTSTNADDIKFMSDNKIRMCCTYCQTTGDYWAGAVEACGGNDKMPTLTQLAQIGNYIYETDVLSAYTYATCEGNENCRPDNKAKSLGFSFDSGHDFYVWSNEEFSRGYYNDGNIYDGPLGNTSVRIFGPDYTRAMPAYRNKNTRQAVCIED